MLILTLHEVLKVPVGEVVAELLGLELLDLNLRQVVEGGDGHGDDE